MCKPTAEVGHNGGEMWPDEVRSHTRKESGEEGMERVTDRWIGVNEFPENWTNQFGEVGNQ